MTSTASTASTGSGPLAEGDLARGRDRFMAGVAALEAGDLAAAEAAFRDSLAAVPGRPSTLANLGTVLVRGARFDEALAVLGAALERAPEDADAWTHKAWAHAGLGDPAGALAAHERAIATRGAATVHDAFGRANALALLGRADEALAAYDATLALAPGFAEAWSRRGSVLRETGRHAEAAAAWRQAVEHGADRELHAYYLAGVGGHDAERPSRSPRAYVEGLFDEYADAFGGHLVQALGYRAHARLVDGLDRLDATTQALLRRHDGLDLGCGSGLCAPGLAPRVAALDGLDVSRRMLEQARRLGLYRDLVHDDLAAWLPRTERRYGVVVAADVFIYVGALDAAFEGVRRVLVPGGVFAFTVERPADEGAAGPVLQPSLRWQHGTRHVRELAARHGYAVESVVEMTLREEQGAPVRGHGVYLRA